MTTISLAGVEVPRIGLGTNRLTRSHAGFIRDAVEAGVRHIDTAHLYTGGESEQTIGEALDGDLDGLVVATKGGYDGAAPDVLRAQIEQSLRALRVDCIPLYYLHRVDAEVGLEASLETIKEYVDAGAIRAVGISEVGVESIERAREVVPIAAVQNHYNRAERKHDAVIDFCEREDIVFVPYFPLRGGSGTNAEKLAWLLGRSPVVAPIPGTLSLEHLRENLAALELVS
jgi:aryl-alcohol dehydrogenase-like predicted oxidoreductase